MKHFNYYALMSAMLLTGAFGFTSCSSDDEIADGSTTTGDVVKTQFAISIPKSQTSTRMTEGVVQEGTYTFRGIQNIRLIPLELTTYSASPTNTDAFLSVITLDAIDSGIEENGASKKIYEDVNIPVGANHFLFYGEAGTSTSTEYASNGALETTITNTSGLTNTSTITSNLKVISTTAVSSLSGATNMIGLLNGVLSAADSDGNTWASQTENDLATLYTAFTKLQAGSSNSIKLALQNLYNQLYTMSNGTDVNASIAQAIRSAITATTYGTYSLSAGTADESTGEVTLSWLTDPEFPTSVGLPEGAAQVSFNETTSQFSYGVTSVGATNNSIDISSITYPASLWYFDDTELRATTSVLTDSEWPTSAANWASATWTGWTTAVASTSRTIALKDNVNYGMALLKTTVKTSATTLQDNTAAATGGEQNRSVTVGTTNFQLTGVLVGGQPNTVDWAFLPTSTESSAFAKTIYDNTMNGDIYATYNTATPSTANYTLVLDTKGETTNKVNIAVEFTNNSGTAFYGCNNQLIEEGQKFYLVGTLDATDTGNSSTPEGATTTDWRVFMKDYTTTANLTIGSLQNAYVTIPDLRATNLQLGLSVDLSWEEGYTFDITIQ